MERFPVGGSKDAVFNFLRNHGFVMSKFTDKHWDRADGIKLHIYASGSRARIVDQGGTLLADDTLDKAVSTVKGKTHTEEQS